MFSVILSGPGFFGRFCIQGTLGQRCYFHVGNQEAWTTPPHPHLPPGGSFFFGFTPAPVKDTTFMLATKRLGQPPAPTYTTPGFKICGLHPLQSKMLLSCWQPRGLRNPLPPGSSKFLDYTRSSQRYYFHVGNQEAWTTPPPGGSKFLDYTRSSQRYYFHVGNQEAGTTSPHPHLPPGWQPRGLDNPSANVNI